MYQATPRQALRLPINALCGRAKPTKTLQMRYALRRSDLPAASPAGAKSAGLGGAQGFWISQDRWRAPTPMRRVRIAHAILNKIKLLDGASRLLVPAAVLMPTERNAFGQRGESILTSPR